jgi:uncharacterized membrane protein HdeD (DUF308 family)
VLFVREHWVLFLTEGIALVVLRVLAIALPLLATLAVTFLFGRGSILCSATHP